ncbi:GNAT family N-acetyltransferase [Streptomyces sp. SID3343]|uniref:GNAT family N-acetyltransferase n=1 Tax=Streptomyces sp. SID3343 TaxID=2690260 RepID=UPI00136EFEE4|nr:GNAT family N-acetyltransferase [Streptomyces sp. SID3343]MYW02585.1 GNAT family N-acetyltransferase [Streptomyces sp. SID3343]
MTSTANPTVTIAAMRPEHAGQVLAIYRLGIETGNATFESAAPAWPEFDAGRLPDHRFVARDGDGGPVLGWIAASASSTRAAYAGVVETSVYVRPDVHGRGVGRALLAAQIASTEAAGIWTVRAGIFPENAASLALHAAAGFRTIGTQERVARHHGTWRDVVLLERRSAVVG